MFGYICQKQSLAVGYPIYLSTNKITHLLESILENMHTSTHLAQLNSPSSLIILYTY